MDSGRMDAARLSVSGAHGEHAHRTGVSNALEIVMLLAKFVTRPAAHRPSMMHLGTVYTHACVD